MTARVRSPIVKAGSRLHEMHPLAADLEFILETAEDDIRALDGVQLFVTGGTGFVGTWLLEALIWSRRRNGVGPEIEVLTRDPSAFATRSPHLASADFIRLTKGDVLEPLEAATTPDAIIHGATPVNEVIKWENPRLLLDTIVDGMRNVLDLAASGDRPRMLFTSSGAVYGRLPPELSHVSEEFTGGPDPMEPGSVYSEGKRVAELLGSFASATGDAAVVSARLFALVGPYQPIDTHFAVGNFIRDALSGGPIIVEGDGTAFRSYQYAADMAIWLLALLVRGEPGRAYNVGSSDAIDIASLARLISAETLGTPSVEIRGTPVAGRPGERYVPSVDRASDELGLVNQIGLDEGVRRTMAWHRSIH